MPALRKVAAACAAIAGLQPSAGQAPADAAYVPDRQCATCHRAIYDSYQAVGMARSFSRPRPGGIIEDFENNHFYHPPSRRHYEMVLRNGAYVFRRYQLDEAGEPINLWEQPVSWIIGSGSRSRGYLYQTPAGELYELPLVWYTQTRSWGMAPGYDRARHDGITRQITRDCMFCHNAYPAVPAGSDAYGMPHLFPQDLPEGTGCQRCHGPGGEHVRLADDLDVPLSAVSAAIVNPGRLPPERRDDVCFQCHLQPTSRLTSIARRFGRDDYSYRPGEDLGDYLVHLDHGDREARRRRFEINHHAWRLRQSACYARSAGALSCLTCHDPHRRVAAEDAAAHYRDRCLTCHDADDCDVRSMPSQAHGVLPDDCITCHMPKRRTQDVVQVVMTDHLITRRVTGDPLAPLAERPLPRHAAVELYVARRGPAGTTGVTHRAIAAAADGSLAAVETLESLITADPPAAIEPYVELGTAQLRAGRFAAAIQSFTAVTGRAPAMALGFANLGVALAGAGRGEEAVTALTTAIELAPEDPDAHYNLAATLARLRRDDEAVGHYLEVLRLRPNHAKAWLNLGNLHARGERYEEAVVSYRAALAVNPDLAAASGNLGSALRLLGK